jgi:hypothetical protein
MITQNIEINVINLEQILQIKKELNHYQHIQEQWN